MVTIIKEFDGRYGKIRLEKYDENGRTEYHVKHDGIPFAGGWYLDKVEAIKYYQFLCAKY